MIRSVRLDLLLCSALFVACADETPERKPIQEPSGEGPPPVATDARDAAPIAPDDEGDAGRSDAGSRDPGTLDASVRDDGTMDAALRDAGELDAGVVDAQPDAAIVADASMVAADASSGRPVPKWGVASNRCRLPRDCLDVTTIVTQTRACCTEEIACGLRLISPAMVRDQLIAGLEITPPSGVDPSRLCLANESVFTSLPPQPDNMRVKAPGGKEVLIAKDCNSASMSGFVFPGCCMPNNRCALSTYTVNDTLAVLAPSSAPFNDVECVPAAELNTQLRATRLAGFGHLVDNDAPCDYAGTFASTPPAEF